MKFMFTVKAAAVLTLAVAAVSAAQASAVSYIASNAAAANTVTNGVGAGHDPVTQRNLFKASLASFQTEAFNMAAGNTSLLNDIFSVGSGVSLASTGVANTTSRVQYNPQPAGTLTGRFNTTGDPVAVVTTVGSSGWFETNKDTTTVQFTTAVSAFGTFITDVNDFRGSLDVSVFNGALPIFVSSLIISGATGSANGALAFFGYTNDTATFDKVVFSLTQAPGLFVGQFDFIGFDDFITGPLKAPSNGVPEPSSIILASLSLGLLAASRRRKSVR